MGDASLSGLTSTIIGVVTRVADGIPSYGVCLGGSWACDVVAICSKDEQSTSVICIVGQQSDPSTTMLMKATYSVVKCVRLAKGSS